MSWTAETNIKGPKGDKGDQGIQGPPGSSGTGTGNVVGPASAVADRIAVYNGTSGTVIKDGGKTIAELGGSAASGITVTPAGNIAATNVQAALVELDNEKVAKAGDTMTGNLQISKANPALVLQKTASGQTNQFVGYNDVNARWQIQMGDSVAESGSNAGSNFTIARYTDAGAPIDAPLAITRSTGVVDFKSTPTVSGVPIGGGGGTVYMQDTPPVGAPDKSMWFETDSGMLFARYNDGNSAQWVHVPGGVTDAVRYATAQTLTSAQAAQARANIWVTKKNHIINGGMQISQENGSTAGNPTTPGYYPVDQFALKVSATTVVSTAQQVAVVTPGGSPNRFRVAVTTADAAVAAGDIMWIDQNIEGVRAADLLFGAASAKTITVQFGVKAPAGTYSLTLLNSNSTRSYVAEYVIAGGEANTDIVKSVTIPGDVTGTWLKDNGIGVIVRWGLMVGTTYQQAAGSWAATGPVGSPNQFNFAGQTAFPFELFDVSLTEGSVAPPFQLPDYASELALCRRYYFKSPGRMWSIYQVATAGNWMNFAYNVTMRAAPTVTFANITYNNMSGLAMNNSYPDSVNVFSTQTATGTGYSIFDIIANARL